MQLSSLSAINICVSCLTTYWSKMLFDAAGCWFICLLPYICIYFAAFSTVSCFHGIRLSSTKNKVSSYCDILLFYTGLDSKGYLSHCNAHIVRCSTQNEMIVVKSTNGKINCAIHNLFVIFLNSCKLFYSLNAFHYSCVMGGASDL